MARSKRLLRVLPVVVVGALLTTILAATPARAEFVSSKCEVRGPVAGDKVNVCVRLETVNVGGVLGVQGYGALDHIAGGHPNSVRLRVEALHVRAYIPPTGPEAARVVSNGAVGYRYINDRTEGGFIVECGVGYKAVMTYGIRWSDGSLTRKTNFYTPLGRWTYPGCSAAAPSPSTPQKF
jgi:hypothetical protein